MAKKTIENLKMGRLWTSYMAAVEGILKSIGYFNSESFLLMGMTGFSFNFIIHKTICPSGITVYDWSEDNFLMLDRIGVNTGSICIFENNKLNTKNISRDKTIEKIKKSIDEGKGVVVWAPTSILEFGIIRGYDDDDRVFFVSDVMSDEPDPLLYDNLGMSGVPFMYVQFFNDKVNVNPEKIYRDSLEYGFNNWNKRYHMNPYYASGKLGYENMVSSLERADFDRFGLTYNLAIYNELKQCCAKYIEYVDKNSKYLKGLGEAVKLYGKVAENFNAMARLAPFKGPTAEPEINGLCDIFNLTKECMELEDKAMKVIEKSLKG